MINFRLKYFVEQKIENFDPKNPSDLIRAEKFLRAESRISNEFDINEIETFLNYYRNQDDNFDDILQDDSVEQIYAGKLPENPDKYPVFTKIPSEKLERFGEIFTPKLKEHFAESVRKNLWRNLGEFYRNYNEIVSPEADNFLQNIIHSKNQVLISNLYSQKNIGELVEQFPYSTDPYYYQLVQNLGNFDDDIRKLTNAVAQNQQTDLANIRFLAKIIIAMSNYSTTDKDLNNLLQRNKFTAIPWLEANKGLYKGFLFKISTFFDPKTKNKHLVIGVSILFWILFLALSLWRTRGYLIIGTVATAVTFGIMAYRGRNIKKFYYGKQKFNDFSEKFIVFTGTCILILIKNFLIFYLLPGILTLLFIRNWY